MWLSLIVALVTYFLSPKDTATERKQALVNAAIAGGVTYGVENYTDWGKNNLAPLNGKISGFITGTPNPTATETANEQSAAGVAVAGGVANSGLNSTIAALGGGEGIAKAALGVGAAAGLATGNIPWKPILVGGAALLLLTKD